MNVKAIKCAALSLALALVAIGSVSADGHDKEKRPVRRRSSRQASDADGGDEGRGTETKLLDQLVDDEPELCSEQFHELG